MLHDAIGIIKAVLVSLLPIAILSILCIVLCLCIFK